MKIIYFNLLFIKDTFQHKYPQLSKYHQHRMSIERDNKTKERIIIKVQSSKEERKYGVDY